MTSSYTGTGSLVILLPLFNDWDALLKLLGGLDATLAGHGIAASVLVVDDGSTAAPPAREPAFAAIRSVELLELRRNLGHQRAIAIGLTYLSEKTACDTVLVMDSDGEDNPRDVPRLLERLAEGKMSRIVFARRTQRSESMTFRLFYAIYRAVYRTLVGNEPRVGNFSAIPRPALRRLVVVSELWSHYAAAVFRSRIPVDTVPTARARRLDGRSQMNFFALVIHGLSAIAVNGDVVGVRLLAASGALIALSFVGVAAAVAVRFLTDLAIPGWATTVVGLAVILCVQAVMFAFILSVTILSGRNWASFIPLRDYELFVGGVRHLYGRRE